MMFLSTALFSAPMGVKGLAQATTPAVANTAASNPAIIPTPADSFQYRSGGKYKIITASKAAAVFDCFLKMGGWTGEQITEYKAEYYFENGILQLDRLDEAGQRFLKHLSLLEEGLKLIAGNEIQQVSYPKGRKHTEPVTRFHKPKDIERDGHKSFAYLKDQAYEAPLRVIMKDPRGFIAIQHLINQIEPLDKMGDWQKGFYKASGIEAQEANYLRNQASPLANAPSRNNLATVS